MGRRRKTRLTLTGTRIFVRRGKYMYSSPTPILNPKTGKVLRWHILCTLAEGEFRAREIQRAILGTIAPQKNEGSFRPAFLAYREDVLARRQRNAPKDPERLKIWNEGGKSILSQLNMIENAFAQFDLDQIYPKDIATFVDQWAGRRASYAYRSMLTKFFEWCCRRDYTRTNPAKEVKLEKLVERSVYVTDEQFVAIRVAMAVTNDDAKLQGDWAMMQCYIDLLYLLYQRGTDVRLLRWDQIKEDGVHFTPTKTEKTSGKKVIIPMTPDVRQVLDTAKSIWPMPSVYVIRDARGQPYEADNARRYWDKACKRAEVEGVTLKDIRAKAATDAVNQGYDVKQVSIGLAHTDVVTTQIYLKRRVAPTSQVTLKTPGSKAQENPDDDTGAANG